VDRLTFHDRAFRHPEPDVLCISQGATYDFLTTQHAAMLRQLTRGGRIPYVVLCLYNDERSIARQSLRDWGRDFLGGAARVAFVSEHNRRLAERQLACDLPNALVLQNPVNVSDTAPLSWPSSGRVARLACVARLSIRHKGQDALLDALRTPPCPSRPWQLRLYGKGPDEQHLRALVSHYGLAGRVHFMGHVPDVQGIWAENELLVLPSYGEGTPLALLEAMLCGRPAVATDVGGNAEWIDDGKTGFIAAAPTARSIGDALGAAWAAHDRWPEMGRAARASVLARYDPAPGRTLLKLLEEAARADERGADVARRAALR
jgi:glycosyltransferase involved in cell wall biosynthesis